MRLLFAVSAALIFACSKDPASPEPDHETNSGPESVTAGNEKAEMPEARLWDREGLSVQVRMDALRARVPEEMGWEPGATSWQASELEIPSSLSATSDELPSSPGNVLLVLAMEAELGHGLGQDAWEHTMRVYRESDDSAIGIIMQWGFKDDSVAGRDLRLVLGQDDEGWFIREIEERWQCQRRVTEDNLCA